eukprot:g4668.t1
MVKHCSRWTLTELNTGSSLFQTYGSTPRQPNVSSAPHLPGIPKKFQPIESRCHMLFRSSTQDSYGRFYMKGATPELLMQAKPWIHGTKTPFTKTFDNSGMFKDTSISSILKVRERESQRVAYKHQRAMEREAEAIRAKIRMDEAKLIRLKKRQRRREAYMRKYGAATVIQCMFRARKARKRVRVRRRKRNRRMAKRIQRAYRSLLRCRPAKQELIHRRHFRAASHIQKHARRKIATRRVNSMIESKLAEERRIPQAVSTLQRVFRGHRGRKKAKRRVQQRQEQLRKDAAAALARRKKERISEDMEATGNVAMEPTNMKSNGKNKGKKGKGKRKTKKKKTKGK